MTPLDAELANIPWAHGVRAYFDQVAATAALPPPGALAEGDWQERARRYLRDCLAGLRSIAEPESILVPHPIGRRAWLVPPLVEQIVVESLAQSVAKNTALVGDSRVFGYRSVRSVSGPHSIVSQVESWRAFQRETKRRRGAAKFMLQIDLRRAHGSIDRRDLWAYLGRVGAPGIAVAGTRFLVDGWMGTNPGVPLVNDSLFFLANLYLRKVDELVGKNEPDFIRFVDEYRFFGDSRWRLERLARAVSREISSLGFSLNSEKTLLAGPPVHAPPSPPPAAAVAPSPPPTPTNDCDDVRTNGSGCLTPVPKTGGGSGARGFLEALVEDPARRFNVGLGRVLLGTLQRWRSERHVECRDQAAFRSWLGGDADVRRRCVTLLSSYQSAEEEWRAIVLLHVIGQILARPDADAERASTMEKLSHPMPRVRAVAAHYLGTRPREAVGGAEYE